MPEQRLLCLSAAEAPSEERLSRALPELLLDVVFLPEEDNFNGQQLSWALVLVNVAHPASQNKAL